MEWVNEDGDIEGNDIYPLDDKLDLFIMNGRRSRYTQAFAGNAAYIMATLTTREGVDILDRLLGIHIATEQLEQITLCKGEGFLPKIYDTDEEEANTPIVDVQPRGFLVERMKHIENDPNKDEIIRKAVFEGVCGSSAAEPDVNHIVSYTQTDGKGVNGVPGELSQNGKDGKPARRFECKLGAVFTQSFDKDGLPLLRNGEIFRAGQTNYIGTVEKIDQFRLLLRDFAEENGVYEAAQRVFLSDAASCLAGTAARHFPDAIVIIDKFHSVEHLNEMVDGLGIRSAKKREDLRKLAKEQLDLGNIEELEVLITKALGNAGEEVIKKTNKRLEFFTKNKEKMRYGLFTAVGLFIGSGVIEAACKTIIQKRMECAGMRWTKDMAAVIIALRCAIQSKRYDNEERNLLYVQRRDKTA